MNSDSRMLPKANQLKAQLLRSGAGSIGLKISNIALGLGLAVVLARSLGPEGYGIYAYVYALVSLMAIPAQFGLPTLIIRETATADVTQQWGLMRGLWRWANFSAATLSLLFMLIGASVAFLLAAHLSTTQLATFAWGLVLVPLITLGYLRGAALRGLRKVMQGLLPEQVIRPALLIILILVIDVFGHTNVRADQAMALHALAAAVAFAVGMWLLRRGRPTPLTARPPPRYESMQWFRGTLPLALISGMWTINTQADILLLGALATARDAGIYRVATLGATLVALGLTMIGVVSMPYFARLYKTQRLAYLQSLATAMAVGSFLLAFPILITFILLGKTILGLFFGPDYRTAYMALVILAIAQSIKVIFGLSNYLLQMSGYENAAAKRMGVATACNVVFNLILIPYYGVNGAAIATAGSMLIETITLWVTVRRQLHIDSSLFSLCFKHPNAAHSGIS